MKLILLSLIFLLGFNYSLNLFSNVDIIKPYTQISTLYPYTCESDLYSFDQTRVQQLLTQDKSMCYLSVYNRQNSISLIYRSFVFTSQSKLLIFLSFGPGPDNEFTGAKEFFFFPRNFQQQKFSMVENSHELKVETSSLYRFYFNIADTSLINADHLLLTLDSEIRKDNEAGVDIIPQKGIVLELPFTMGDSPSHQIKDYGVFKNSQNQVCKVLRKNIFVKNKDDESVIQKTDSEIQAMLKKQCRDFLWTVD